MNIFITNVVRLAASAVALVLGASVAQANGNTPASACEAMNNAYGSQTVGGFGAVQNKSTGATLNVNCPLITNYYARVYVNLSATKQSSVSMTCSVATRDWTNTSGTVTSQSLSGTGQKDYYFDVPQMAFNSVRCGIPKATTTSAATRSQVNGYYYYEY